MIEQAIARGVIRSPDDGGHDYLLWRGHPNLGLWECRCGAWMASERSGGPSPFGRCPLKPDAVQTSMDRRG